MMANMSKRQRRLIVAAGAAVVLLIVDRAVIEPLGGVWQAHADKIERLNGSVANGRSVIARGLQTRRVWAEMQSGALPRDKAQAEHDVLSAFESWGRASSVELGSIKPVWKHGGTETYSMLECRLDATGSLAALSRFVYELESSPLALRADSVGLISRDDTGDRLTLSLIVTGLRLAPLEGKR